MDETKELAARHSVALKEHERAEERADKRDQLKACHAARRAKLEQDAAELKLRQEQARAQQSLLQSEATQSQQQQFNERVKLIQEQRAATAPTGLAAFLAGVSGVELVRIKIHAYQDRKREAAHDQAKQQLAERQALERQEHDRRLAMQNLDMTRKQRAL